MIAFQLSTLKVEFTGLRELLLITPRTEVWIGRTRPDDYPYVALGITDDGRYRTISRRFGRSFMVVTRVSPVVRVPQPT